MSTAKTLQGYLSHPRKLLGAGLLQTSGAGYVISPAPGALDVEEFERLAADGRAALEHGDAPTAAERPPVPAIFRRWRGNPGALAPACRYQRDSLRVREARSFRGVGATAAIVGDR